EQVPVCGDGGVVAVPDPLQHFPRLIVGQAGADALHVLDAPDGGDLPPGGEQGGDVDLGRVRQAAIGVRLGGGGAAGARCLGTGPVGGQQGVLHTQDVHIVEVERIAVAFFKRLDQEMLAGDFGDEVVNLFHKRSPWVDG